MHVGKSRFSAVYMRNNIIINKYQYKINFVSCTQNCNPTSVSPGKNPLKKQAHRTMCNTFDSHKMTLLV